MVELLARQEEEKGSLEEDMEEQHLILDPKSNVHPRWTRQQKLKSDKSTVFITMPNWEFVVCNYGVGTGNSVANYCKVYTEYLVFLPNFVILKIFKVGNTDWYYCF